MPVNITFLHPYFLLLLLLVPVLLYYWLKKEKSARIAFVIPTVISLHDAPKSFKNTVLKWLPYLRTLALMCIIIALARPQKPSGRQNTFTEGIDIILVTDVSGSMQEQDFLPNRLAAAKSVAADFVENRPNDRIGLVIFSGESFTLCPLTADHGVLRDMIFNIGQGILQDGTAIGMGLATATDRLRESKAKSKVVILLTDGVNNSGIVDPATAAQIAAKFKIRVYTIGMSARPEEIDDKLMQQVAETTGGKFFRATNERALYQIYAEIDRLEKTKTENARYLPKTEAFFLFLWLALLFICLEFALRYLYIKSVNL